MGNNFPTYGTITNHQQIQNKLEHAQDLKVTEEHNTSLLCIHN
jgi:hypothetical protein